MFIVALLYQLLSCYQYAIIIGIDKLAGDEICSGEGYCQVDITQITLVGFQRLNTQRLQWAVALFQAVFDFAWLVEIGNRC